ncbi:MAG: hypothetical protein ACOC4M_07335 [Promethearchaeia archaeon]
MAKLLKSRYQTWPTSNAGNIGKLQNEFAGKTQLRILKLLEHGHYGKKITRKVTLSQHKIYKIIRKYRSAGYIRLINNYPKLYQLTQTGKYYKQYLEKQQNISPEIKTLKKQHKNQIRIHNVKFAQEGGFIPSNLYHLQGHKTLKTEYKGLKWTVKIIKNESMKNWDYFQVQVPLSMFGGIKEIRLTPNKVIYMFNRGNEDQYVDATLQAIEDYEENRREDCKTAREWLNSQGFSIPAADLNKSGKFHYEGPNSCGLLEKFIIKLQNGREVWNDDSFGEGDSAIESDDPEYMVDFVRLPQHVKKNKEEIKDMKQLFSNLNSNLQKLNSNEQTKDKRLTKMEQNLQKLTSKFTQFVDIVTNSNLSKNESNSNSNSNSNSRDQQNNNSNLYM